ncbi:MAG: hypothetical protein GKS02_14250 [Alphaproteobacteria bacterium]|nr:hypothetical protein [Alphaproteobacteria bacterium]
MRLAEKPDDLAENTPPEKDDVPPDNKALVVFADKPKAPPPASLSANLIPRHKDNWGGVQVEQIEQRVAPTTAVPSEVPAWSPQEEPAVADTAENIDEAFGARAQQAILEKAFVDLEPVAAAEPIDRAEFESARSSASKWRLYRSPSSSYWERVIKDASIFIIVFAVLLLVILQTM